MTFSEQWLREHEARQAAYKAQRAKPIQLTGGDPPDLDLVAFTLAEPTILLNKMLRAHWSERRRYQQSISDEIGALGVIPADMTLMQRAVVTVVRYSLKEPDYDGMVGGVKYLGDCLIPKGEPYLHRKKWIFPHPAGLSIVADDSPSHLTWDIRPEVVRKRAEQRTEISIQRIG